MVYIDAVKKDHIGNMTRKWRGPWQVIKTYGPGVGYLFHNGHKAHFERVRLYEPRMINLKVGDNGNFVYLGSTEDPILEIFPQDSALDETWDPPHPLPEPGPLDVRKQPHRKCKDKKRVPPVETGSDTNFENPDYISPEFDPRLSETTQVPSRPDTPMEHSPQMSDVDNRAANLMISDNECRASKLDQTQMRSSGSIIETPGMHDGKTKRPRRINCSTKHREIGSWTTSTTPKR